MFLYQKLDLLQYHTTNMLNQEVGISEATKEADLESMLMIVRMTVFSLRRNIFSIRYR